MASKIIYGFTSFWIGIVSIVLTGIILTLLRILPPATYLFKIFFKITSIPLIISFAGIFFYYLQSKIFIVRIVKAALILNIIGLLGSIYILLVLYSSI
jgi:hypothetical protein